MFRLAVAQINTVLGDKSRNLNHISDYSQIAKEKKSQIICFPELATTGYSPTILGKDYYKLSETQGGTTDLFFSELSNSLDLIIICGFIEKDNITGMIYNSAGIWIPGEKNFFGIYRKMHLFSDEKLWFSSGETLPVFDTKLGRLGVMICYDAGFPEVARTLALKKADMIFLLSAWREKDKHIWYINSSCRAVENAIHLAAVNRWGQEGDTLLFGGSQIIGPKGDVLSSASENGENIIYHDIDINIQDEVRKTTPYLDDRRPECYTSLVKSAESKVPLESEK